MSKTCIIYDDVALDLKIYDIDNALDTEDYDIIMKHKRNKNVEFKVDYGVILGLEKDRKIELDPTIMKKIWLHNKGLDKKEISKEIKNKEKELQKLEDKIDKLKTVIKFTSENISGFLDSEECDYCEYIHNKYVEQDFDDWY